MADVNYLKSGQAYQSLAILLELSDEEDPFAKQKLMKKLDANEQHYTDVMKNLEDEGIIHLEKEPGDNAYYYFNFEDLFDWWKRKLIESAEEEYEEQGRNRRGEEMLGAIDYFRENERRYGLFFYKWVKTYFNFIEDSTLQEMCFEHINYGVSWESRGSKDFEYRTLASEKDISWLRTLLAPLSGQEFRKLRKTWYGPGFD